MWEIGVIVLVELLAEGNAEQTSEVTWAGLIPGVGRGVWWLIPAGAFWKWPLNAVREAASGVHSQASSYLLKSQRQCEPSDRSWCCLPPPSTSQILWLVGMPQQPLHISKTQIFLISEEGRPWVWIAQWAATQDCTLSWSWVPRCSSSSVPSPLCDYIT